MKIIVTHSSPDMDAITSVWVIKRFLPGWHEADVQFVPAGEKLPGSNPQSLFFENPIESVNDNEVIHVDTGLGPLDHHQTSDDTVCGASRSWDYVKNHVEKSREESTKGKWEEEKDAISRMVRVVVDMDHFKEVFWGDPTADYHEFSLLAILDGLKLQRPDEDRYYVDFVMDTLDALRHAFQNRIWAEREIAEKGIVFETKWGKGIGFETINDTVVKLAQKMGYVMVARRDPRKGYMRIKSYPTTDILPQFANKSLKTLNIDLTLAYEQLKKMDPQATWFLHVSKKMLLNGSVKNPNMKPTTLSLEQIISVLKNL